jgi:cation channel sperm-associated protein 3
VPVDFWHAGAYLNLFVIFDIMFLTIYTIEFGLKLYCEPVRYWGNNYNRFDFLILALSYFNFVQLLFKIDISADLSYIRVLRGAFPTQPESAAACCILYHRLHGLMCFASVLLICCAALRALRALRSISFVRALRVLVNALIKTLASIVNLLAVLLLVM